MFTIEEYLKSRRDLLNAQIELINLRASFKLAYNRMNKEQQSITQDYLNIFNVSEETKTHIYDSRTIESRKTETEPNTEAVG